MLYYVIAKYTNQRVIANMAVTLDLNETAAFGEGLPQQVIEWLSTNIGNVYHKDEIWRHNQQVINSHLKPVHPLRTFLSNIQAEAEYPHECVIMTVIHACGWNFTRKRKLATSTNSLSLQRSRSTILRIEDESNALRFALEWMR
jgi:hypothetical protein